MSEESDSSTEGEKMKLVIGGAFQGKLDYAKKRYGTEDGWIDGAVCGLEEIISCRGIDHFHEYLRRLLFEKEFLRPMEDEGTENEGSLREPDLLEHRADQFAGALMERNPEIIIVSTELGCGVVPADRQDRLYRELTGRVCTSIAARAEEVVRVICGIGVKLK